MRIDTAGLPIIEQLDLQWFCEQVATAPWKEARSYRNSIPHEYVFNGPKSGGWGLEDFNRLSRVVRAFGRPRNFNKSVNVNFEPGDGFSYFTTDRDIEAVGNLQRGPEHKFYGRQVVPRTEADSQRFVLTKRDGISGSHDMRQLGTPPATDVHELSAWGRRSWTPQELKQHPRIAQIADVLLSEVGGGSTSVLALGCGTGWVLDTGIPPVALYTGVDTSRGMLNEHLLKHPGALDLHNVPVTDLTDWVSRAPAAGWDVAVVDPGVYAPDELPDLPVNHILVMGVDL